jgi:hypothetical protein
MSGEPNRALKATFFSGCCRQGFDRRNGRFVQDDVPSPARRPQEKVHRVGRALANKSSGDPSKVSCWTTRSRRAGAFPWISTSSRSGRELGDCAADLLNKILTDAARDRSKSAVLSWVSTRFGNSSSYDTDSVDHDKYTIASGVPAARKAAWFPWRRECVSSTPCGRSLVPSNCSGIGRLENDCSGGARSNICLC